MQRPMPKQADLRTLVLGFADAFNRNDLDAVMAFYAEDAVQVAIDDQMHRGKRAIRRALEPQFRGDYGTFRFELQDITIDDVLGKAMVRWRCHQTIEIVRGLPPATQLKRLFYRSRYGREFSWYGLDLLSCNGGLIHEKYTYSLGRATTDDPVSQAIHISRWSPDQLLPSAEPPHIVGQL